ncbi:MAG: hypothetical protein IJO32_01330 [Bacilli bacterium]|nr:hypothetical protein [Bacilli bacterium]
MKKIVITVLSILISLLILIIIIVNFSNSPKAKDLNQVETTFLINYNVKSIENIEAYYGDKIYYVLNYTKDNNKYIGILDEKENLITSVLKNELKSIDEIKNNDYSIGYKDDKIIYEVKKDNKNGFIYYYYDALTGEFIKNIKLNK